jgi:two-component system cell cycle sensor histidine kinase/response regulator CckA
MTRSNSSLADIVAFADALPVAVWVGRASGECVYTNREFEAVLGITPPPDATRGNYVGPYSIRGLDGGPYPEDQMPFERVMRSGSTEVIEDLVIHRHDGSKVYLRVFASPLFDERGEISHVVEAFTDRTREVESERERAQAERQLQATQRLESIGSLAGGVAHDFNNLLSIVNLVAAELREGETDPHRLELIGHLSEVSASAAKLTRGLLGFAQRGKNLGVVLSFNEVVRSVMELATRTFERRIEVKAELSAEPSAVRGDPAQLEQVVVNLLLNARDAIPGRGTIKVRTRHRQLGPGEHPVLPAGAYLELLVEDTGTGIESAVRDRVFEPYFTTKTLGARGGTGLGLATVFGVSRTHGGHAEIASTSPTGTTMRVLLPASPLVPEPAAQPGGHAVMGEGLLLVVDDDLLVLKMTVRAVETLGYRVLAATDGAEAVQMFQDRGHDIRAVLLDMIMPGMTGREVYLALRALDPQVRVLLTTGYSLNNEAQDLLELGVRDLLPKPFDMVQLSTALQKVLNSPSSLA